MNEIFVSLKVLFFHISCASQKNFCTSQRKGVFWYNVYEPFCAFSTRLNAPTTTGIVLTSSFHILLTSISRSLYFDILSKTLAAKFFVRWYAHVDKITHFSLFVFDHNVWAITLLVGSVWIGKSQKVVKPGSSVTASGLY